MPPTNMASKTGAAVGPAGHDGSFDILAWTIGLDDDAGTGRLPIYLYPRSACERPLVEHPNWQQNQNQQGHPYRAPIADALWRAYLNLHYDPLQEEYIIGEIECWVCSEYPSLDVDENADREIQNFNEVFSAFKEWRRETVGDLWGLHILVSDGYEFATADGPPLNIDEGVHTGFRRAWDEMIGVGGSLDLARALAVQETFHHIVDSESIDAVRELIETSGSHMDEHQLGTLVGGAVTPMATLYEGSDVRERAGLNDHFFIDKGECRTDAEWDGRYTPYTTECTRKAVKYTLEKEL